MMEEELASTGALEMSLFHKLSLANGMNPFKLAPCPTLMALQALLLPWPPPEPLPEPLPPEPDPLPPLEPPEEGPELAAVPPPHPASAKLRASIPATIVSFLTECPDHILREKARFNHAE